MGGPPTKPPAWKSQLLLEEGGVWHHFNAAIRGQSAPIEGRAFALQIPVQFQESHKVPQALVK